MTQGEKNITISYVLPATLSLRTHLNEWKTKAKYCQPVVKALLSSLQKRFSGLIARATPPDKRTRQLTDENFGSDIYVIAAVLDPAFCLQWLNVDVEESTREKEALRREIIGTLVH